MTEVSSFVYNGIEYRLPARGRLRKTSLPWNCPYITGADVRRARRWLGYTQADMCRSLTRSERTVRGWEQNPTAVIEDAGICHIVDEMLRTEKLLGGKWRTAND